MPCRGSPLGSNSISSPGARHVGTGSPPPFAHMGFHPRGGLADLRVAALLPISVRRTKDSESRNRDQETVPLLTPYVASRSTELPVRQSELTIDFAPGGPRLAYRDPRPTDRDHHGNLWVRLSESTGGRVLYNCMNVQRQRACMEDLLCQICGGPADRDRQGWLFLDWRREESPPTWPERSITSMPPLCVEHARVSARQCPFLRRAEYAVLRVRKPRLHGVSGTLYRLTGQGWRTSERDVLSAYDKPRFPGMLASRLHRELRGVTVVDLP